MGDGLAYTMAEVLIWNAFNCKYETQFIVAETDSLFFSYDKHFKGRQYWVGDIIEDPGFYLFLLHDC